jgi:hypothetical protein
LSTVLFAAFSIAQGVTLARGIVADCGCFGPGETIGLWTMVRTMTLLVVAALCFLCEAPSPSKCRDIHERSEEHPQLAASGDSGASTSTMPSEPKRPVNRPRAGFPAPANGQTPQV